MKTATYSGVRASDSRFLVLLLVCLLTLSSFYCQDLPSLMKAQMLDMIEKSEPGNSDYYFNLLYSVYSFPNIILPIISGMLIDRIGYNKLNIVFAGLIFLGNFIVYSGLKFENVTMLLLGRFVYGLGGESMCIGSTAVLVAWFKGKELAFSQAITISVGRLGSVLNCFMSPYLVTHGLSSPYALACGICLISLMAAVLLSVMDEPGQNNSSEGQTQGICRMMGELKACKNTFWIHVGVMTCLYLSYLPFNMIASSYFLDNWYNSSSISLATKVGRIGKLLSIPLIMSTLFFPVFGYSIDKIGHRLHLLMISGGCMIMAYLIFLEFPNIIGLILFGLGYSLFGSVVWPLIVFLVPSRIFNTALGLVNVIQNFTMTIFPIILAYISSSTGSSTTAMETLMFMAIIAMIFLALLSYYDSKNLVSMNSTDQEGLICQAEGLEAKIFTLKDTVEEDDENFRLV